MLNEDRTVLTRAAPPPDATASYGASSDEVVDLWLAEAGQHRPLVVLVHGGFWRPGYDRIHLRPMANALCAAGWDVAAIEYRRVPGDPDVTTEDVEAALVTAPALAADVGAGERLDDRPIVTIGHSAGGHLVLWAATRVPVVTATVAVAPVADLVLAHELRLDSDAVAAFLGTDPVARPDLDPARLPTPPASVTVIHGDADGIVPIAVTESYAGRHPAARVVRVDGAGHFALIDPLSMAWPAVVAELERLV